MARNSHAFRLRILGLTVAAAIGGAAGAADPAGPPDKPAPSAAAPKPGKPETAKPETPKPATAKPAAPKPTAGVPAKVAEVAAGTLKSARASWWGFDAADATAGLQEAIRSGVPELIVDDTGSDWIIHRPLQLVSNQTIIFSDGVVIQAAEGAFKGRNESLFEARKLSNLSLIGRGHAVLRMRRDDYDDPALYEKAEWRHGIALWDCRDVVLRGLTVAETGGDGLYLGAGGKGTNRNVLVEDMIFDANYRQGVSVISAENLTIRRCRLQRTDGTNPKAGIDFEPNLPGQRLVNCLLEDCVLADNAGGGVAIYTVHLTGDSPPLSIEVKDCRLSGNSVGLAATTTRDTANPVTGRVTFTRCVFDHEHLTIRNALADTVQFRFEDCTLDFSGVTGADKKETPILLSTDSRVDNPTLGGITFDRTVVVNEHGLDPIALRLHGRASLSDQVAGSLLIRRGAETSPVDLESFVRTNQERLEKFKGLRLAAIDLSQLNAPEAGAPREGNREIYLRGTFTFLQHAEAGEEVTIQVTARKVYPRETLVELLDPDGTRVRKDVVPYDNKPHAITFTARKTGLYRLVRTQEFSQRLDLTSSHPGNGILADRAVSFLPLSGRLYFQVPAGVADFTLGVSTDSTAEVALLDSEGREVERHRDVSDLQLLSGHRADSSKSEIWSLSISKAKWAVILEMYAPLVPLVSTNPATLLLAD